MKTEYHSPWEFPREIKSWEEACPVLEYFKIRIESYSTGGLSDRLKETVVDVLKRINSMLKNKKRFNHSDFINLKTVADTLLSVLSGEGKPL